ncbi:hypothetical protein PoB_006445100 [Plakobranchus ocellatus]|uniref:Uncharacterized protein n=1 Tax=Plakobranchus ocellatus TaxID=259542 RepID=A0AAV4D171_9GAST|nr:hypothetical protein PoB_006445100 [Plakobranchus ocellatus]
MTKSKNTPDPSPLPDVAKKPCTEAARGAVSVASKRKAEDLPTLMSVSLFGGWSPFKKFMVISSKGSANVADRSPFKIHRELKSILGDETIEVTKLGSGDLMVELKSNDQAKKLGAIATFLDTPVTVSPHKSLNSSKGGLKRFNFHILAVSTRTLKRGRDLPDPSTVDTEMAFSSKQRLIAMVLVAVAVISLDQVEAGLGECFETWSRCSRYVAECFADRLVVEYIQKSVGRMGHSLTCILYDWLPFHTDHGRHPTGTPIHKRSDQLSLVTKILPVVAELKEAFDSYKDGQEDVETGSVADLPTPQQGPSGLEATLT